MNLEKLSKVQESYKYIKENHLEARSPTWKLPYKFCDNAVNKLYSRRSLSALKMIITIYNKLLL